MAQFTSEEREGLYSLFRLDEHEVREGSTSKDKKKIQWFTYVRREAIQKRLDTFFFGEWELYFLNPETPAIYHREHVDCSMGLSIRGIRREFNGSQDGGGLNGAKGAATDALKRVASMWGVGLYLQDSPQIWTENYVQWDEKGEKKLSTDWKKKEAIEAEAMRKVGQWLKSIGAAGESLYSEGGDTQQSKPAPAPTPASNLEPEAHGLGSNILTTNEIRTVDIKKSDTGKIYIVAEGITFFTREPFRALAFPKEFIDKMENVKKGLFLPAPIRIAYTEITVGDKKQRTPISVMRTDTELEVQVKAS
jgi:hypothetical protein